MLTLSLFPIQTYQCNSTVNYKLTMDDITDGKGVLAMM